MSSANRGECVTTGGLYRPTHLCVAHFELQFGGGGGGGYLRWSMFQEVGEVGGLYGVSERGRVIWVQGSQMLRNRLPDGRSWKRLWEGWVGSFTILLALLEYCIRKISRMEGRGAPMIFSALFTVCWRVLQSATLQLPYQTVMQLVSMLSMVPL